MTAINISDYNPVSSGSIVAGYAVQSNHWYNTINSINTSLGATDNYIPYHPVIKNTNNLNTSSLNYRVTPNGRECARYVSIGWTFPGQIENLASKATTIQNIKPIHQFDMFLSASIESLNLINISSVPRSYLDLSTEDYGVDVITSLVGQPINTIEYSSIGGLFPAVQQSFRRYYLAMALPAEKGLCWSNSTINYLNLIKNGVILTRKVYVGDTTGKVQWHFYLSTSSASYGGTIKITNTKNARSHEFVIAAGAPLAAGFVWYDFVTADYDFQWECEDLTTETGMPGNTWNEFNIEFKSANAAGTFYCASICCEEEL